MTPGVLGSASIKDQSTSDSSGSHRIQPSLSIQEAATATMVINQERRPHCCAADQQTGPECEAQSLSLKERLEGWNTINFVFWALPTSSGRFCLLSGSLPHKALGLSCYIPLILCRDPCISEKIKNNETQMSQKDTSPFSELASGQDML